MSEDIVIGGSGMRWYVYLVTDSGEDSPNDNVWGKIKVRAPSEESARKVAIASAQGELEPHGSLKLDYKLTLTKVSEEEPV